MPHRSLSKGRRVRTRKAEAKGLLAYAAGSEDRGQVVWRWASDRLCPVERWTCACRVNSSGSEEELLPDNGRVAELRMLHDASHDQPSSETAGPISGKGRKFLAAYRLQEGPHHVLRGQRPGPAITQCMTVMKRVPCQAPPSLSFACPHHPTTLFSTAIGALVTCRHGHLLVPAQLPVLESLLGHTG